MNFLTGEVVGVAVGASLTLGLWAAVSRDRLIAVLSIIAFVAAIGVTAVITSSKGETALNEIKLWQDSLGAVATIGAGVLAWIAVQRQMAKEDSDRLEGRRLAQIDALQSLWSYLASASGQMLGVRQAMKDHRWPSPDPRCFEDAKGLGASVGWQIQASLRTMTAALEPFLYSAAKAREEKDYDTAEGFYLIAEVGIEALESVADEALALAYARGPVEQARLNPTVRVSLEKRLPLQHPLAPFLDQLSRASEYHATRSAAAGPAHQRL